MIKGISVNMAATHDLYRPHLNSNICWRGICDVGGSHEFIRLYGSYIIKQAINHKVTLKRSI
jgi:hypothetical protein